MLEYLIVFGAVVNAIGIYSYIKDMVSGRTKPNRITWAFWAIAPLTAATAAISDGVLWAAVPVLVAGFGPVLVLVASFANKHAYWRLGVFDYFCGSLSAFAMVLWLVTREPSI